MKAYKIDLSGFTGKVREVVNTALIAHGGKIGYRDEGRYTTNMLNTDFLVFWEDCCITAGEPLASSMDRFETITADAFLALTTAKDEPSFKPFDRVLVRQRDSSSWTPSFYGWKAKSGEYQHCTALGEFVQCIPYEGNEALLGTTDSPE